VRFEVDMPETGALTVEVQAADVNANLGEILSTALTVDTTPPTVSFTIPPVIGGTSQLIRGVVVDPHPHAGGLEAVVLEVEPGGEQYRTTGAFVPNADGSYDWSLAWTPPEVEGQTFQLRAYAIDMAGNVGPPSDVQTTIVDTLPPQTIIAEPEDGGLVNPRQTLVWGIARDGWSPDRVQVSVDGDAWLEAHVGDDALPILSETVVLPQDVQATELWALFVTPPARVGPFTIQVRAIDPAGNVETPAKKVRVQSGGYIYYLPLFHRR